jgi:hypothetical protein
VGEPRRVSGTRAQRPRKVSKVYERPRSTQFLLLVMRHQYSKDEIRDQLQNSPLYKSSAARVDSPNALSVEGREAVF